MTREAQKLEEERALKAALALMSFKPDDIRPREGPDFELKFGARVVGVELVSYSSSDQARQRESLWQQLQPVIRQVRKERGLPHCRIRMSFIDEWPPARRDHRAFAEELCSWAAELFADGVQDEKRFIASRDKRGFETLHYIDFEPIDFPMDWDWNGGVAWIGTQEHELQQLLAGKAKKAWPEGFDERWLIVYGGTTVGRMTSLIEDEIFDYLDLTSDLEESYFGRFIVTGAYGSDRAFSWSRAGGWEAGKTPYQVSTDAEG